ncbi:molybdenum cofactor guanylyltransferase [bacterium]|nr:molybdenum cofactor guanylyltransferase [bacterium]
MNGSKALGRSIVGVVLCGGKSTRFGSNKALALYQGRSLVSSAASLLSQCVDQVVISVGQTDVEYVAGCVHIQDTIQDKAQGAGPLAGIAAAFASTSCDSLLVLATDLPLVEEADLNALLFAEPIAGKQAPLTLGRDAQTQRVQPLCGLWDRSVHASLEGYLASGKRAVMGFIEQFQVHWIDIEAGHLTNINKKDDLGEITDR